ncbi:sce7726 family protein [Lacrimispora sp.]|uniref:sce7726 family protein n=1 Tax=Lacrimispora sp. TaxID=2719234 RepID=UPI0028A780A2|nr:sce7726 family protein [Lacrimispora sp.]
MNNNLILKRFFSKSMLADLLSQEKSSVFECVVKRYIKSPNGKTYDELISEIYTYMGKEYRTEYLYKNTILNKLLFAKHDYRKTVALTELPIDKSKADFVMINGKGVIYEIKTELDNLDRIETQIQDYYKAFTEVIVVTYEENVEKVMATVPKSVGIMLLTKRQALRSVRNAEILDKYLDYYTIFKILRKSEFEQILLDNGLRLPEVIQFEYYKECYNLIREINIQELQKEMLKQLKSRMRIEAVEFCLDSPEALRFLIYFDGKVRAKRNELEMMMKKSYGG